MDGGYYDNYGMASLIDWLDRGLTGPGPKPSKVLIIAIRSFPEVAPAPPEGERGFFFQMRHPIDTLSSVRHTGQLARSETDLRFVLRKNTYSVPVTRVVFEYSVIGSDGLPLEEPLSWHLTPKDKEMLRAAWNADSIRRRRDEVRRFSRRPMRQWLPRSSTNDIRNTNQPDCDVLNASFRIALRSGGQSR